MGFGGRGDVAVPAHSPAARPLDCAACSLCSSRGGGRRRRWRQCDDGDLAVNAASKAAVASSAYPYAGRGRLHCCHQGGRRLGRLKRRSSVGTNLPTERAHDGGDVTSCDCQGGRSCRASRRWEMKSSRRETDDVEAGRHTNGRVGCENGCQRARRSRAREESSALGRHAQGHGVSSGSR